MLKNSSDKVRRILQSGDTGQACPACNGFIRRHVLECPHATKEDMLFWVRRYKAENQHYREKAVYWLSELQLAHGKISQLKNELRKIRSRKKP